MTLKRETLGLQLHQQQRYSCSIHLPEVGKLFLRVVLHVAPSVHSVRRKCTPKPNQTSPPLLTTKCHYHKDIAQ